MNLCSPLPKLTVWFPKQIWVGQIFRFPSKTIFVHIANCYASLSSILLDRHVCWCSWHLLGCKHKDWRHWRGWISRIRSCSWCEFCFGIWESLISVLLVSCHVFSNQKKAFKRRSNRHPKKHRLMIEVGCLMPSVRNQWRTWGSPMSVGGILLVETWWEELGFVEGALFFFQLFNMVNHHQKKGVGRVCFFFVTFFSHLKQIQVDVCDFNIPILMDHPFIHKG